MKLFKKLIPLTTVLGATAGVVVPLTTSCGGKSVFKYNIKPSTWEDIKPIKLEAKETNALSATYTYLSEVEKKKEILANDLVLDMIQWSIFKPAMQQGILRTFDVDVNVKINEINASEGLISFDIFEKYKYTAYDNANVELKVSGEYDLSISNMDYRIDYSTGKWMLVPRFEILYNELTEIGGLSYEEAKPIINAFLQGEPDWEVKITHKTKLENYDYQLLNLNYEIRKNYLNNNLLVDAVEGDDLLLTIGSYNGLGSMADVKLVD